MTLRGARMGQPQQPGGRSAAGGMEQCPDLLPRDRGDDVVGMRQDGGDPGGRGDPRGLDLGRHPASPVGSGPPDPDTVQVGQGPDLPDGGGTGTMRGFVVDRVDIAEQDERLGPREMRHECGQAVVVPEPDLVGGHRVVLVDHRDHTQFQQPEERSLGVAVVGTAHDVLVGQQDLPDHDVVSTEGSGVVGHEQALSHRGGRLLGGEVPGPVPQTERIARGCDGTTGHQDDLGGPIPSAGRDGVDQPLQTSRVDSAVLPGQR